MPASCGSASILTHDRCFALTRPPLLHSLPYRAGDHFPRRLHPPLRADGGEAALRAPGFAGDAHLSSVPPEARGELPPLLRAGSPRPGPPRSARGPSTRSHPRRNETRPTCVSTGSAGTPKQAPRRIEAVFRPTPGRAVSSSIVRGTRPSMAFQRGRRTVPGSLSPCSGRSLWTERPPRSPPWLDFAKAAGSGQERNSAGVTPFTRSSVHCAARTVATSSSNGLRWSRRTRAPGYALARKARTSFTGAAPFPGVTWRSPGAGAGGTAARGVGTPCTSRRTAAQADAPRKRSR